MTEIEILARLWEAQQETPFATLTLQRKLDLRPDQHAEVIRALQDLSDTEEVKNGYRVKRVASTVYKLIQIDQRENDT